MSFHRRVLSYFRADWPVVLLSFALTGASSGLALLAAWPLAILVDTLLGRGRTDDAVHRAFLAVLPDSTDGRVVGLAVAAVAIKLLQDGVTAAQALATNYVNWRGVRRARQHLFAHLQSLSLAQHRGLPEGAALYRLTLDVFGLQNVIGGFMAAAVAAVTVAGIVWLLWVRSPALTLVALATVPVLAAVNIVCGRRLADRAGEVKEAETHLTTHIQRSTALVGLVQAFGRQRHDADRFAASSDATIASWWRQARLQVAHVLLVGATVGAGAAGVLGYGGLLAGRGGGGAAGPGGGGLSPGDLIVFTSYVALLWPPLCVLTGVAAGTAAGVAGARRVFQVLDLVPDVTEPPAAARLSAAPRELTVERVTAGHGSGQTAAAADADSGDVTPAVRGASLRLTAGRMVGVVGPSGSGKSTLAALLPRLADPAAGRVALDGVDVRDLPPADVRRHVVLVPQDPPLFAGTVAENIAYARPGASPADVRDAAERAGAAAEIDRLPGGFDAQVGADGRAVSAAVRRLVAVARAVLADPAVLVLDDPADALAPAQERRLAAAVRALAADRAVLVLARRGGPLVHACDEVFAMGDGRLRAGDVAAPALAA